MRFDRYLQAAPGFWDCVMRWLVVTNQPLTTVDDPWFHNMVTAAHKLEMIGCKVSMPISTAPFVFIVKLYIEGANFEFFTCFYVQRLFILSR